jgi:hypothetical protein
MVEIAGHFGRAQQRVNLRIVLEAGVVAEAKFGDVAHLAQVRRDTTADEAGILVERRNGFGVIVDAERRDIGGGDLQVGRHAHLGHRDQRVGDDRITDLTTLQDRACG